MSTVTREWGSTAAERERGFACDRHLAEPELVLHRAVDVDAAPAVVFRWLCQLRAAPYSHDLIDNFGRRSPPRLTPGLERLELGQRFMTIFRLVEFEQDEHVTLVHRGPAGTFAVTYLVVPRGGDRSRLVVRVAATGPWPTRRFGPALDLVMMRKQLLTLKRLAEPLPHIDEHATEIPAGLEAAWRALEQVVFAEPRTPARLLARALGATQAELPGFRVARSEPPHRLELEGEHRFSRYRLRFELEPSGTGATRLTAVTDADFPGVTGAAYRALVIGTRTHVLAVRRILAAVASAARRTPRRKARRRP